MLPERTGSQMDGSDSEDAQPWGRGQGEQCSKEEEPKHVSTLDRVSVTTSCEEERSEDEETEVAPHALEPFDESEDTAAGAEAQARQASSEAAAEAWQAIFRRPMTMQEPELAGKPPKSEGDDGPEDEGDGWLFETANITARSTTYTWLLQWAAQVVEAVSPQWRQQCAGCRCAAPHISGL